MRSVNDTDLLTTAEAAELTGWSVPTINRWADDGTLPTAHKLPGIRGARLFLRADVDQLPAKAEGATA